MNTYKSSRAKVAGHAAALISVMALACNTTPPPAKPQADVFKQNQLLGRGGNFGKILYEFEEWDTVAEKEEFDLYQETGLQHLRVNTGPFAHADSIPPYTIAPAFFDRLDWTIGQALSRGLAVIIDNHEYWAMGGDPIAKKEMFLSTWRQMAEHYRDYSDSVFFGILNEPNNNLSPYLWNYILMDVYPVIRESNPHRTLVIGPGDWNGIDALEEFKLPEEDRNIIVDIHYYSPHNFTHQGFRGREAGIKWGTPEDQQVVAEDFIKAAAWGEQNKRPLYLGEFGVYRATDTLSKANWLGYVIAQAEKNNISWGIWNLEGSSFGIYDRSSRQWIEPFRKVVFP